MKNKVQKFAGKISTQRHLLAIRDGMATGMFLVLIGSVFLMIAYAPFEPFTDWLNAVGLQELLGKASDATFGFLGFAVTFSIAYHLARYYKDDGLSAGLTSLASYVLLTPLVATDSGSAFLSQYFGTKGLFIGIIVSLLTTEILHFLWKKDIGIKMPATVPPNVAKSFAAFVPGLLVIIFWLLVLVILKFIGVSDVHTLISGAMGNVLSFVGNNIWGVMIIIFIQCFFWMFGIHGAQVTAPILEPILYQNTDANRIAFQAGRAVPNIVTYEFMNSFVFIGGAGAVLGLALLVFFLSKSEQNKALGKLSLAPVSFQIAEPLLFGFPVILNPIMVIPFVLAPVVSALIAYYSMYSGLVPKPVGISVPWTTPAVLGGFLATGGDIRGALLNIVTIGTSAAIYYVFFKRMDNDALARELGQFKGDK